MSKHDGEARELILGVDVGSVSISLVAIDRKGRLVDQAYTLHRGNFRNALKPLLERYAKDRVAGIATPSGMAHFREVVHSYHLQVALMKATSFLELNPRSILHVGAERFFLIELDEEGGYLQTSQSSSCAAGTGSFLDQQALRLKLTDTHSLSEMALQNRGPVPDIAARCSVFAKTDLIHAQQKGYGLEAICDSLCRGLADNIADTLFNKTIPESPVVMTGGVSRNQAVVRHLQRNIGKEIVLHPRSHLFPALGAAYLLFEEGCFSKVSGAADLGDIIAPRPEKHYFFEPLTLPEGVDRGTQPVEQYRYGPVLSTHTVEVQVDLFRKPESGTRKFHLGIDVGSTSTKAVWTDPDGNPVAGFYTYTSGQPLKAVQALFEAMEHLAGRSDMTPEILSCGTTGSGRKFIGSILRADLDVDEITAHARAAFALNPETDTIIEIGGQDAKFTQMKDGVVTFSHMNTVCAAGTGSFLEELSGRLGVSLEAFEQLAVNRPAPLASDRCTVFMERDINQLLSNGYSVEEVLATMIHSVRENYLKKVASEAHIGDHICFQGATARNRALVAAFEQRLQKPVYVSSLCHLTGALGTALILREEYTGSTMFRGLDLYKKSIPVRTEICDLCRNRCAISIASVNGDEQAYGFL
ncbi:MAG: acyl-CoA dehydratase activase, partial [Bacteroidales bacterium]